MSLVLSIESGAAPRRVRASYTIKSWHRLVAYTDEDRAAGQDHWFSLEQRFDFSKALSLKAQGYGFAGSSRADLAQAQDRISIDQEMTEFWPGDVFGQYASGPVMLRLGYQRIFWQEGFGISYTNFINARDNRVSIFDDSELIFRSTPLANFVVSGENLSFQALYIPFSQTDISAPVSRWGARSQVLTPLVPMLEVERLPSFKSVSDYGARITWAGEGFDVSAFAAHLEDRAGVFSLSPTSGPIAITLVPETNPIDPVGITSSFGIRDFIVRVEYMRTPEKYVNRINGFNLSSSLFQEEAFTVGLDSPSWPNFMFSLQHSISILDGEASGLVRNRIESVSFGGFNYTFNSDRILGLAIVYLESDQSVLGRLSLKWPLSRLSEIETSYEGSTGSETSRGLALSNLSRFFVQLNFTL